MSDAEKQVDRKSETESQKLVGDQTTHSASQTKKVEVVQKPQKPPRTKEQKSASFKKIKGYAGRECCSIIIGFIFLLGGMGSDLLVPMFIGKVVDMLANENYDQVGPLCLYMIIVVFVSGICVGIRAGTFNILSERIARNIRQDLYHSIVNKDIAFFDEIRTGELVSRLNSDIQVIQDTLGTNISMFLRGSLFILVVLVILFVISAPMTGAVLGAIIPLILMSAILMRVMRKLAKDIQATKAKMNTIAEESFTNIRTVKAFQNEETEIARYNRDNGIAYELGKKQAMWKAVFSFASMSLLFGSMAGVIYIASILYNDGKITIGEISSFLFYMIMLLFNFGMVSMVFGNVASIFGASDKVVEIMDHKPSIPSHGGMIPEGQINGKIEFKNVKFRYPSKPEIQILKGVTFTVDNEVNRVVALCGTSGCGKSSIISLIERFYDPEEGEILFNGHNLKDIDPKWYHGQISIVQQEPVLFSGTIGENLMYGLDQTGKSQEQITAMMDEATEQANAYAFIHDKDLFPLGYDTIVGERGVKLSGGQKQRVAIARALINKPKVLLLDEATSALDAESEHQVQQALDRLISQGKQTVIVVAHRLSTIKDANEIICMQKGEVKERGTHQELIALDGFYKKLVNRQLVSDELAVDDDE